MESDLSDPDLSESDHDTQASSVMGDTASYTLGGVLRVIEDSVDTLVNYIQDPVWTDMRSSVDELAKEDQVLTSTFTGAGTFEVAADRVVTRVQRRRLHSKAYRGHLTFYSVTDNSPLSKRAILGHSSRTRPRHQFGRIEERLYDADRHTVDQILSRRLGGYTALCLRKKAREIEADDFRVEKRKLSGLLVKELMHEFKSIEFKELVWCDIHCCFCSVSPRSDPLLAALRWSEAGGNSCIPWSRVGGNAGWLHESTLGSFCWVFSMRYYEVDSGYQENAVGFDEEVFEMVMCNESPTSPPRSVLFLLSQRYRRRACSIHAQFSHPEPEAAGHLVDSSQALCCVSPHESDGGRCPWDRLHCLTEDSRWHCRRLPGRNQRND